MKKIFKFIFIISIIIIVLAVGVKNLFPFKYREEVLKASEKYNIDVFLIEAIIKAESNFNTGAVSPKGAKGLMQVTDSTAKWCAQKIGIDDFNLFSPSDNIEIGTYYFSYLMDMYDGDVYLASAAYNAGYGNVNKWLAIATENKKPYIPYKETQKYVRKIDLYSKAYGLIYKDDLFAGFSLFK